MELTDLYYFHEYFNREFFRGRLQPVIFEFAEQLQALRYNGDTIPPVISVDDNLFERSDRLFILTALLCEMTHQHCQARGIADTTGKTGKHTEAFTRAAWAHGMANGGNALQPGTIEKLTEHLQQYDAIKWH